MGYLQELTVLFLVITTGTLPDLGKNRCMTIHPIALMVFCDGQYGSQEDR